MPVGYRMMLNAPVFYGGSVIENCSERSFITLKVRVIWLVGLLIEVSVWRIRLRSDLYHLPDPDRNFTSWIRVLLLLKKVEIFINKFFYSTISGGH
jgi:hypothetical protein